MYVMHVKVYATAEAKCAAARAEVKQGSFVKSRSQARLTAEAISKQKALLMLSQVLVQGMMANRYMNTFRDDILGWNKKLMNVADVNQIASEIQRTWSYLESLFIHSEEVSCAFELLSSCVALKDQCVLV